MYSIAITKVWDIRWFAVTFVAVYARYTPSADNPACRDGGCSRARVIGLLVFVTFSGYWITE